MCATAALLLEACGASPWNNPYPAAEAGQNILYGSFAERPKHLDPISSYSSDEYVFVAQIYEPPLQYHYLQRPYRLTPLTAANLPQPLYLDRDGGRLPADAPADQVARSIYRIRIRPGILYQPHPALARDEQGAYRYHALDEAALEGVHRLADFPHTGTREVTAADYVYQLKRMVHPRLHSPIAGLMGEYVQGMQAYATTLRQAMAERGKSDTGPAYLDLRRYPHPGVRLVDRYTYEIEIKGSYPQFIYWLAMPFFAPMPWEAERFYAQPGMQARNLTLDWYPLGSGAYMLAENNPNRRMVLLRNPNFRGEAYPSVGAAGDVEAGLLADAGRTMPFIERAVYSLEKEDIPYWNKFLQGYYDTSGVSSDSFDQAVRFGGQGDPGVTELLREKGIRLSTAVSASQYYAGFNMLDPVVGGSGERARKLRRAVSIAVDYEEFLSIFTNGRGIAAQGPIPPGIFGHLPGAAGINPFVYQWQEGGPRRLSLARARALLTEAGYPEGRDAITGEPLVLHLDSRVTGPDGKSRMDWMRKQFAKLNIQLDVRATDYNRFREKMRKGTAQIFEWGWNADYPDPENFLFLLYGANGKVLHGGENAANYANPEFDALFERMKNMANGPERQAIIDRMLAILRRDAPWLWGYHPLEFELQHAWYGNAKPNLMANNTLKYLRVDPAMRRARRLAWNRPVLWPLVLASVLLGLSLVPAALAYRRRLWGTAR